MANFVDNSGSSIINTGNPILDQIMSILTLPLSMSAVANCLNTPGCSI